MIRLPTPHVPSSLKHERLEHDHARSSSRVVAGTRERVRPESRDGLSAPGHIGTRSRALSSSFISVVSWSGRADSVCKCVRISGRQAATDPWISRSSSRHVGFQAGEVPRTSSGVAGSCTVGCDSTQDDRCSDRSVADPPPDVLCASTDLRFPFRSVGRSSPDEPRSSPRLTVAGNRETHSSSPVPSSSMRERS